MKYLSMLFCVTLFAVTAPAPTAHAQAAVSIDFFYDALDPYGSWIYTPNYGYVWEPAVSRRYGDWAPYSDGYWAYTDAGWTWISNEDFGWATYHYGRWIRMFGRWFWVPGHEWAPAWVSWRQADDFIGWAPLPPEARWFVNIGFNWWADSYYDIGPSYYSFVPIVSFATRSSLRPFIVDRRRNITYIDRSVNITNITYQQNVMNNIFVGGPDPARIERFGGNPIRRLTLRRDDEGFRRDWLGNRGDRPRDFASLSRIERDQLLVAAPTVRRENAPSLPPRVKERFDRPEVDRGWRDVGDAQMAERLRTRQREELAKTKAEKMPEKTPVVATSDAPPPAVGRELKPEERKGNVQRPDPRTVDEGVRKGERPTPAAPGVTDQPPQPGETRRAETPERGARSPQPKPGEPDAPVMPAQPGAVQPREVPSREAIPENPDGNKRRPGAPQRPDTAVPPQQPERPSTPQPQEPRTTPPRNSREFPSKGRDEFPGKGREAFPGGGRQIPPNTSPEQPRTPPATMPDARPESGSRTSPMPQPETPRVQPSPMPQPALPPQARPPMPENRPEGRPEGRPFQPDRRPGPPEARPMPDPQQQPSPQADQSSGPEGRKQEKVEGKRQR